MKHPEWVGGKPPAAVGGGRWLGVWLRLRSAAATHRCQRQGGGYGLGAGGCGRQNTPVQARRIPDGREAVPPAAQAAGTARADVGGGGEHCREEESAAGGAGGQRLYLQRPKAKTPPK